MLARRSNCERSVGASAGRLALNPFPDFVSEAVAQLCSGENRRGSLNDLLHYLRFAEPDVDCSALALPELAAALTAEFDTDPDAFEAERLAQVLSRLGPAGALLLGELVVGPHARLREAAALALASAATAPVASEPFTALLSDPVPAVRATACGCLARVRPSAETARLLVERVGDADADVALAAMRSLGELWEAGALAVPTLLEFAERDADPAYRLTSLGALARIGVPAEHRHRLRHVLLRRGAGTIADSLELEAVLAALYKLGSSAADLAPDVEALLDTDEEHVGLYRKIEAAGVLLKMVPTHEGAERTFRHFARASEAFTRRCVALELASADPAARVRLGDVVSELSRDPDDDVRDAIEDPVPS